MGRAQDDRARQQRWEEALQQSGQRFERLVEAAKDYAVFMTDSEGRVSTWNEGAEQWRTWWTSNADTPRR